jgi:hypothetical protein
MRPYHVLRKFRKYGLDLNRFATALGWKPAWFHDDLRKLKAQMGADRSFELGPYFMVPKDTESAGATRRVYFQQDLYVAQKIHEANPLRHVDIGSRLDGFVAHVASYREIEVFDIRPMESEEIRNVVFRQADLMQLPKDFVDYCDSISSLHAVEHFGLGRYGDDIDFNGHLKAIENITQILKRGGTLYFSVPMGLPQRIEFNGHRVFSTEYLIERLSKDYDIESFSYIDDSRDLTVDAPLTEESVRTAFGCRLGCGIFICRKK